jgi:iron complex outermembrane recepter protein
MKTSITTLFILFTIMMHSQTFEISGSISNFENRENTITISLFESLKSTIVKINYPNTNGKFNFVAIPAGSYFIRISGNEINDFESSKFEISNQNILLETYNLTKKSTQLNEVVIINKKPIVQVLADKTIFNVQNSLSASGISAFELLRKAPGIIIDNNDNLIVEGKTGVQIYIDGKPSVLSGQDLTNYLKTIQSSDVDLIEIITNPSSKYEASGNAGIVNIKLKKDKRFGTNGSLGLGFAVGKFARYNSSLSLNNRSKKTNLFGTYSNNFNKNYSFINLYRIQSNTIFDSRTTNVSNENTNNIKIGLDYFANKKHTFGIVVNSNFNNNFSNGNTRTPIISIGNSSPNQILIAESNSKNKTYNVQTNLNYRFSDTLGYAIVADFDYGKYKNRRTNFQPNFYFNGNETLLENQFIYRMNTPIDIDILSFKTDYEQNLWKGKLGLGMKTSVVNTNNIFDFYDVFNGNEQLNLNRTNTFEYRENINAIYFNYSNKWKKINYQFGLRAEQTISKGDLKSIQDNQDNSVKRNYTNYFPSTGVTFNANENNVWAMNYSKRIERPNYKSLNPFEMQLDELSFSRGNPFLQPQYTDNFKISHTYKYTLTTNLSYSFIKDFFAEVTASEGLNRSVMTTKNVANHEVYNLGVSYAFSATKWWEVYFNAEVSNSSYKGNDVNFVSITQNNFNFYAQNTFSLPNKIKLEVSGWLSSPSVWGGTYRTKSLGSLDLAVQKKVFNEKLSVRMAISDLFYTSNWQGDTQFGDVFINANGGYDSRQFRLNLSYNFGNSNVKSTNKKNGIDDENKRI